MQIKYFAFVALLLSLGSAAVRAQSPAEIFQFTSFSEVNITDDFWKPKIDNVATVTLKACIYQTETNSPRIRNFEKVARAKKEKHEGIYYDDSDVYKALEAMGYSLKTHPNPILEMKADEWIDKIAAAQLPDGYLNTYYTLGDISKRWTDVEKHEDYCAGHLIEAAIAYNDATGKRKLLDVAIRFANHIDSTFRIANKHWFSGHEEIELALVKLYKVTNDDRYLKLADWYLQQRGKRYYDYKTSWITPSYWQDSIAIKEQHKITGHAVRAMYLYTGAADVGSLTGDMGYMNAMKSVWEDVVHRNMYVTGGIGSSGKNEGFSKDYDLPNNEAYCETCASVGMIYWNQRMAQLTGESKYVDVLEKTLYNSALDGISLSGDRFFYDNTLESSGKNVRKEWFGTACCPSNISRLITSLGDYIYGKSTNGIWINLFVSSNTKISLGSDSVNIKMTTAYPWKGNIKVNINPMVPKQFDLHLRLPGWSQGEASPGDLYRFLNNTKTVITLKVNGKKEELKLSNGFIVINREWKKGDVVDLEIPMNPQYIVASDSISCDKNKVAIQRGPFVYCMEGIDNNTLATAFSLNKADVFTPVNLKISNEKVIALNAKIKTSNNGVQEKKLITLIPYYTWANRGASAMNVWLPIQ